MPLSFKRIRKSVESGRYLSVTFSYLLRHHFFRKHMMNVEYNQLSDGVTVRSEEYPDRFRHILGKDFRKMKKREFDKICMDLI